MEFLTLISPIFSLELKALFSIEFKQKKNEKISPEMCFYKYTKHIKHKRTEKMFFEKKKMITKVYHR